MEAAMDTSMRDLIRKQYQSAIGRHRKELITPALILDLDAARQNIETMMAGLKPLHMNLRPHIKGHKSVELAKMQIDAGANGVCTATVWEAITMGEAGIQDVLVANQVAGREKIAALANAARTGSYTVALDDAENALELSNAAIQAGSRLDYLIELDVGQGRGGVRTSDQALELARMTEGLKGLRFRGMMGYEGHCMLEPDRELRVTKAREAMDFLSSAVELLNREGYPSEVVSAGGTGTWNITGADPRVTELQAGSYLFMDMFHGSLVPGFRRALTVLGTVCVRQGDTVVFDSGRKSIGIDFILPTLVEYPYYTARYFAEEHALFDVDGSCNLRRGDTAEFVPGYAPTTVNLYDFYHVVEKDIVTDIWPIIPRGPGHCGLISGKSGGRK